MGSGGSGGGGAAGSGGSPAGGGWGPTMGSGGNAYGRGGVGGIGTAGTMSSGAGGSAMGGFGNTGAGGSGMAGISTHSGETPAGFTPAYGDPRGLALGMNANGTYGGVGIRENGQTVLGYIKSINPTTKQVQYRTVIQRVTPSTKNPGFGYNQWGNLVKMNTALPTQTSGLTVNMPGAAPGYVNTPPQQFNRGTLGPNFEKSTNPYGPGYTGGVMGRYGAGQGPDPSIGNRGPLGGDPGYRGGAPGGLDAGPGGPLGYGGARRM